MKDFRIKSVLLLVPTISIGLFSAVTSITVASYVKQAEIKDGDARLEVTSKGTRDTQITFHVDFVAGSNNWYSATDYQNIEVHFCTANNYSSAKSTSITYYRTSTPSTITYTVDFYNQDYVYVFLQRTNPKNVYEVWGMSKICEFDYMDHISDGKQATITVGGEDSSGNKDPYGHYYWEATVNWATPVSE